MSTGLVDINTLISSIPGVYGGEPRLARSGLPILQVAAEVRAGRTISEIIEDHDLDAESGYAGLAFYFANKAAVDAQLDERASSARALAESMLEQPHDRQRATRAKHRPA